jgi:diguanylate cyclase (GGDEF)-like protein/PAS domain S-box-containing protein
MYSKEVREPTDAELRVVDVATRIAGIAIERRLAAEALRDSEQRFRTIFDVVNDGIIVHELTTGAFLDFNPRLCEMFDYTRDELLKLDLEALSTGVPPYTMSDATPLLKRAVAGEAPTFEWQCKAKDGRQFWIEVSVRRASFGGREVLISSARDITERKHAEERIARMARQDIVTGLPNRALLNERLSQALLHARRDDRWVTVLFVGLDNFKLLNSDLGHNVGDEILKAVAGRMVDCVMGTDTVARHGGDEFVVVLTDQPKSPALIASTAQNLRAAIAEPIRLDGHEFKVTCSLGIASCPCDGTDAKSLLANAEAAMYRAKELGRDRFQFYVPELNTKAHEQFLLQAELRNAVARSEFALLYQPQVDLRTGRVFAAEALIRWKHPTLGIILPTRFIGIAEDTGLIMPIGDWVLREACRQNRAWQAAGLPPIVVSVNVSAQQFMDRGMVDRIVDVLKESGLEAKYLELELTESLIMQDVGLAVETMEALRRLGIKRSIDDFGTGYSSLSALKTFPVERLKIDMSFVDGLPADENDKAVAGAVISLGHKLKMRVIAEGVETEAQAAFLRENDCDEMQGFLYSRPIQPEQIEALLGMTPR